MEIGLCVALTEKEARDLEQVRIGTSYDPINWVDQTSQRFFYAIFEQFGSDAPYGFNGRQYKGCGMRATRAKWDAISADCQTFLSSLGFILSCNPIVVTEDQILSMAIARHKIKRDGMAYDSKDYPHSRQAHHLSYNVLCRVLKFKEYISIQREGRDVTSPTRQTISHDSIPEAHSQDDIAVLSPSSQQIEDIPTQTSNGISLI